MNTSLDRILKTEFSEIMEKNYIDYAMSVIIARALPDVRDGLKPVQRRTLYDMYELGIRSDKPYRKSARIVGDTMGKYHPHGDSSIYDALVVMSQDFKKGLPLVDGHGNFGNIEGDGAAAMRYTEARLSRISSDLLADIKEDTVEFVDNFDGTESEPTVLPSRFPNLLVNGTTGIAVGMATNIPPHNLGETIDAVVKIIDNSVNENRETSIEEIMEIIKGPDFPTGGTILGRRGIEEAYRTGRGKIRVRATTEIETLPNGKTQIVATELPYMVNKANLQQKIAELVKLKKIDGITAIRDESNREGVRLVIEVRRDANANVILNQLYKHTQMQDTFGVIMLALDKNQPKVMNILQMLKCYLDHQKDVVTRRTKYRLNKAEERDHILQGLLKALDFIDEVINIIRSSANTQEAKDRLIERFEIDDVQAQAIVDMRLRALTGLEREKLLDEHNELVKKISELKAILADEKLLLGVIRDEIKIIGDKYRDERRTSIGFDELEILDEDLIPRENVVIAMTRLGYIKRMSPDNFKAQHRGGKGIKGMQTIEDDYIEDLLMTTTHHYLNFFTSYGRVYRLKAYEIPEGSRTSRGVAIVNLLQLGADEKITAIIPVSKYDDQRNFFMVTKNGTVKKTLLSDFANVRKNGLIAINLVDGDKLIEVKCTTADSEIFLVTKQGMCIRFKETDVRRTGRSSIGVIGMNLNPGDEIIGMQLASQGTELLFISERGYGKRTLMTEFTAQKRGGKGVKCYKIVEKTGDVMGVKAVHGNEEIIMMTTEGIMIRIQVSDVNTLSRITSGVKLMNLPEGVKIAQAAKVRDRLSNGEKDFDSVEEAEAEVDAEETDESGFVGSVDDEDDEETKKFHGEDEDKNDEDDE